MTTWALLEWMTVGTHSGRSTNTSNNHFPLRTLIAYLFQIIPNNNLNVTFTRHETLALTKVHTYGLLYECKGSTDSLKPPLLAAHQGLSVDHRSYHFPNTIDTSFDCQM